jgi:predicted DNA-binding protein
MPRLTVDVDEDVAKRLKMRAIDEGRTKDGYSGILRELIQKYLEEHEPKK